MVSYTNQQLLEELYHRWFNLADANHDGKVSGQEAVAFFMPKAGLPQETLSAIWAAGSRGAADLDGGSFRTICQLIWYAQNNGNQLPPNSQGVVSKILSGIITMPPPKLMGLPVHTSLQQMQPVGIVMPSVVGFGASPTGSAPSRPPGGYTGGPTGGMPRDFQGSQPWMKPQGSAPLPPAGFAAAPTGQFGSTPASQFGSGLTGQVPAAAPTRADQFGAALTGQPDYPAITPMLAKKYATGWQSAQKDAEGNVPGAAVLSLVASIALDRSVKKSAWDLVAGSKSSLTTQQLFIMLYLLDLYPIKGGLPDKLPAGVFPPNVHMCFQAAGLPVPLALQPEFVPTIPVAQQNPVENLNLSNPGGTGLWTMNAHAPKALDPYAAMPPLPPHVQYAAPKEAPAYSTEGRLPQMDMGMLGKMGQSAEGRRLQQEIAGAGEKDKAVWQEEQKLAEANKISEFYTAALQELTMFKGRSQRALLDVQSRAESAKREAEQQRARYEQVYAEARKASSQNQELQDAITEAVRSKAEWESKLAVLQQELQSLAAATPQTVLQLQQEVAALEEAVNSAEMDKAHFNMETDGLRDQKARLEQRLVQLKDQVEATKANWVSAEEQVDELKQQLATEKAAEEALELGETLSKVAALYKELHAKAREAGVTVPEDAVIASNQELVWPEDALLGARNWTDFDNAGWTLVESLPNLPEGFCTAYFISMAQTKPAKAAAPAAPAAMENPYGPQADAFAGMVSKGRVPGANVGESDSVTSSAHNNQTAPASPMPAAAPPTGIAPPSPSMPVGSPKGAASGAPQGSMAVSSAPNSGSWAAF